VRCVGKIYGIDWTVGYRELLADERKQDTIAPLALEKKSPASA
jgi:hypothetical protein